MKFVMILVAMSSAGLGDSWSSVFYQIYSGIFRALHAEKLYRYADFIVCQELAPAHRTKNIITFFADCVITG